MKTAIIAGIAALALTAPHAASAQNVNTSGITQDGPGQTAYITQEGTGNTNASVLSQIQSAVGNNVASLSQSGTGNGNAADMSQIGGFNTLNIQQSGFGSANQIAFEQFSGEHNNGSYLQTGQGMTNTAQGYQYGDMSQIFHVQGGNGEGSVNTSRVEQHLSSNYAQVLQEGIDAVNTSNILQYDHSHAIVSQTGESTVNTSDVQQLGNGHVATVDQRGDGATNGSVVYQDGSGSHAAVTQY